MAISTSTGITLGIVALKPATEDSAGYAALTFIPFGELTSLPAFGPSTSVVEHKPLATGIVIKSKGFINFGSVALEAAYDDLDAGQIIALAGVVGAGKFLTHSFKLLYPSGRIRYWFGQFFTSQEVPGSADSMVGLTAQVEINSVIVNVPAP